jgi:hypothetical protein
MAKGDESVDIFFPFWDQDCSPGLDRGEEFG